MCPYCNTYQEQASPSAHHEKREGDADMAKEKTLLQLLRDLQETQKDAENLHHLVVEIMAKLNYRDGMIISDEAIEATIKDLVTKATKAAKPEAERQKKLDASEGENRANQKRLAVLEKDRKTNALWILGAFLLGIAVGMTVMPIINL